jgi:uroporphyrin-3 C-methyltransferase
MPDTERPEDQQAAEPAPEPVIESSPAADAATSGSGRGVVAVALVALVVALGALAIVGWQWYYTRNQLDTTRLELARRLTAAQTRAEDTQKLAGQVQDDVRALRDRIGTLESKLQQSQSQQAALEALYKERSQDRDETVLAEIEQMVFTASEQLQLAGNVRVALIALENADKRLQRLNRPQLADLRQIINRDIDRLRALPSVDTVGISVKLDNLIAAVDDMPLAMEMRPPQPAPAAAGSGGRWLQLGREMWQQVRGLVRIQDMNKSDVAVLTPNESYFLRQNLKLRLLDARIALLAHDETTYRSDLDAAHRWLERYYDASDKTVTNAEARLQRLARTAIAVKLPDLSATLEAVRNYKLTHGQTN